MENDNSPFLWFIALKNSGISFFQFFMALKKYFYREL
jgi:hypothetical protein